jgi:hypothetical protein
MAATSKRRCARLAANSPDVSVRRSSISIPAAAEAMMVVIAPPMAAPIMTVMTIVMMATKMNADANAADVDTDPRGACAGRAQKAQGEQ